MTPSPEQSAQLRAAVLSVTRGTQLTRAELGAAISAACGDWVNIQASAAFTSGWPHWRLAVDEAVARGVLCFGAPQGNRVTFVRSDEWLPETTSQIWTADDGALVGNAPAVLVEVARRYLGAYGPATHQEFARWFAMPAGLARQVYAALGDELVPVDVDGHRSWALHAEDPQSWQPVTDQVRLLGYFDCFAVGSHPRDELAPPKAAERAAAHARAFARGSARRFLCGPLPVLLIDGVVSGVWTYRQPGEVADSRKPDPGLVEQRQAGGGDRKRARSEQVRVEVFGRTSAGLRRLLAEEVVRLAAVLDRDLTLSIGPADIAAHL